jgi:hypothetical protein
LVQRLEAAGWIEHFSPTLVDGTNGSTIFRIGRTLKRLLVMLSKSQRGKKRAITPANTRWRFSPHKREKQILLIQEKENQPLTEAQQAKMPLLKRWMERGKALG